MAITKFDDIFQYIGEFGPYQWHPWIVRGSRRLSVGPGAEVKSLAHIWATCGPRGKFLRPSKEFAILIIIQKNWLITPKHKFHIKKKLFVIVCFFNFILMFNYYGQIFMVLTPPHWCSPHPDFRQDVWESFKINLTDEDIVKLTIPPSEDGRRFEKCSRYDVNISQIESLQDTNLTNWPITECTYGWTYNFTEYYPSLTSKLNWVCDDDWKPPTAQAIFFIGCVVGGPIFGWLADHFGRLPIIIGVNTIGGTFMVLSTVASSFAIFCIVRFVVGMTHDSNFMLLYILALEYVSPKYRTVMSNITLMIFLTGAACIMPWIALYVRDWRIFGIVIALPSFISIVLPWLIPESVRWLVANGKKEKALEVIKTVAKFNKKDFSIENSVQFMAFIKEQEAKDVKQKAGWMDLLRLPKTRKRFIALAVMWAAIYTTYDGLVRVSENTGYDFFVTFTILGALELPADLLVVFLMEYVGRKHTTVWSLITSGIASMAVYFVAEDDVLSIMIATIAGRFLVTMSINIGVGYILEVLPTTARARGSGVVHTLGIATTFTSPYIVYLAKYSYWAPYFTFGVISVIGGLVTLMLPETVGEKLPETLEDSEAAFQDQHICYNPCKRKEKLSYDEEQNMEVERAVTERRPSLYFTTPLRRMSVIE